MSDTYSIIQFYPQALRREGVNVGVVVVSERLRTVRVRMSANNELVRKHCGGSSFHDAWLSSAKRSLARRLQGMDPNQAALLEFIAKEAGQLVVLPPRPVVIEDPDRTLALLFAELVGEIEPQQRRRDRAPRLDDLFMPLFNGKLVERVASVPVPVVGRAIRGAYKYRNGAMNYIKPQAFPTSEDSALTTAGNLGLFGLMLAKHPMRDHGEEVQQKLIVVARLDQQDLARRIGTVLLDCSVRLVLVDDVPRLVEEVRRDGHPLH
jgi:hypothetical protein